MKRTKILYLDSYTCPNGESRGSDEIGYGITTSEAIKLHLRRMGYIIHDLRKFNNVERHSKLSWIQTSYSLLRTLELEDYDVVFIFNSFHQFPCEVKRILLERNLTHIKIVGYSLGSHWDATDTYRTIHYPGMDMVDLANLMCMDKILCVSRHFQNTLIASIGAFSADLAAKLIPRLQVTGLPINDTLIDSYRQTKLEKPVQVVFNHSPTEGKDPATFFRVMSHVLSRSNARVIVTRKFYPDSPGMKLLQQLRRDFPYRVVLGDTMSIEEYYSILWVSHIQVSTAQHESFGIATLEAMYTCNCCILPNRQSYPEISGGINLYSSEDELIDMLNRYILDSTSRNEVSHRMQRESLRYLAQPVVSHISSAIQSILEEQTLFLLDSEWTALRNSGPI